MAVTPRCRTAVAARVRYADFLVSVFVSVLAGVLSDFEEDEDDDESEDDPDFSELLDDDSDRSAVRRDDEALSVR